MKLEVFAKFSRKGFCRNPRGIFLNKVLCEFCGGFFGGCFLGLFPWKNRRKKPPKNPRQNSNRNLGVSRPKSTLQGSCLDVFLSESSFVSNHVVSEGTEGITVIQVDYTSSLQTSVVCRIMPSLDDRHSTMPLIFALPGGDTSARPLLGSSKKQLPSRPRLLQKTLFTKTMFRGN